MKAKIKKGSLVLCPENKKEHKRLIKFLKDNAASSVIPMSRNELSYYLFDTIQIAIK